MNKSTISYVGWLLVIAALGFYGYGVFEAIYLSWPGDVSPEPIKYSEVLSSTIGSIQALLLANLGMVLGISISNPQSGLAKSLMLNKNTSVDVSLAPATPLDVKEKVQLWALLIYVIVLIACLITWIKNEFSTDPKIVVSIIPESGKMFIGVVLAYLTAVLSK